MPKHISIGAWRLCCTLRGEHILGISRKEPEICLFVMQIPLARTKTKPKIYEKRTLARSGNASEKTYQNWCSEHMTLQKVMTLLGMVRSGPQKVTTLMGLQHSTCSDPTFWRLDVYDP